MHSSRDAYRRPRVPAIRDETRLSSHRTSDDYTRRPPVYLAAPIKAHDCAGFPRHNRAQTDGSDRRVPCLIVESWDDAIVSKSLEGIIKSWNKGAERLFGYAAEEMIGKSIAILIPQDRSNEEPAILERIKRGERVDHYETVRMRKDGSLIDISLSVSPIKDVEGKIIGASKIARDNTGKKKVEEVQRLLLRSFSTASRTRSQPCKPWLR